MSADGGPGTVAIVAQATGARLVRHTVTGPQGDPVEAAYALLERDGEPTLAVLEGAAENPATNLAESDPITLVQPAKPTVP